MSAATGTGAIEGGRGAGGGARSGARALVETLGVVGAIHGYLLLSRVALWVDGLLILVALGLVVWCFRRRGETRQSLGIAVDDRARRAVRLLWPLVAVTASGSLVFYFIHGPIIPQPLLPGFVGALLLYPVWGFLQQLFYLGFVQRGLARGGVPGRAAGVAAGVLYGFVHAPNWPLVAVTTPLGLYLAWVYLRERALLPIALAHGIGGAFAIYFLGLDLEIGATYPTPR